MFKISVNDNRTTSLICNDNMTIKDIVESVLDKFEIDLKYEPLCILL